jgi:hypothetical protein
VSGRSVGRVVGQQLGRVVARFVSAAVLVGAVAGPLHDAALGADAQGPDSALAALRAEPVADQAAEPAPKGFTDSAARVSFDPPVGWVRAPSTALNPLSDPPDPAEELVRYQLRLADASLYAFPVPITSALVRDAGAIITVGVARTGGDMIDLDVDPRADRADASPVAGFFQVDDERTYEGLHVFTRYFVARETDRRLVMRAVTAEEDWAALAPIVLAALDSLRADPKALNAPAAPPPPPPLAQQALPPDPSLAKRQAILDRAAVMIATPYVWGGNTPGRGMDCSAFVSAAWGVARYTTESIGWVSFAIAKDELRPGDAMNLQIGRDPEGFGHVRLFEAWANEARTLVWVYEETPPRAVHRVVVYDDRYQPIRLAGLSNAGTAPLVPAPAPQPKVVPTRRPAATVRPAPTVRPTPRVTPTRTPAPLVTPTPRPSIRPTPRPTRTPTPTTRP